MTSLLERLVDAVTTTEVVILGGGVAGLRAALAAVPRSVQVLEAGVTGQAGSSPLAQGGVAAALGAADSPSAHAADTLAAAAGAADEEAVRLLTEQAADELQWLGLRGARFDLAADGSWALGREAAHSHSRIVHAGGDATGAELIRVLRDLVRSRSEVEVIDRTRVLALVRTGECVTGVLARHPGGALVWHRAAAVVLATGGLGALYQRTTNPAGSSGQGIAMAALAGARITDLEYVQFHPTALDAGETSLPLLTEALRGAGARLVDAKGRPIMDGVHPQADLAPRDVVARAVWEHRSRGGEVLLDVRQVWRQQGARRFPTLAETCRRYGLDPGREGLPVTPAAHFSMGGVWTDLDGRTSLPGLWACGEVACTGVHGANRLASNSLLEGLVFGRRVGESIRQVRARPASAGLEAYVAGWCPVSAVSGAEPGAVDPQLRRWMWEDVGLVRDEKGLSRALARIEGRLSGLEWSDPQKMPYLVARMITVAALQRRESRGSHYRRDWPESCAAGTVPIFIEIADWTDDLPRLVTGPLCEPLPRLAEGVSR